MAYNIKKVKMDFINLPFNSENEVFFMEEEYNLKINKAIKINKNYIEEVLMCGDYTCDFIYLPELYKLVSQSILYYAPNNKLNNQYPCINSDILLPYSLIKSKKILPCFLRCVYQCGNISRFLGYSFDFDNIEDIQMMFTELCDKFNVDNETLATQFGNREIARYKASKNLRNSSITEQPSPSGIISDDDFDDMTSKIMEEVREKIVRLRQRGVKEWAIKQLLDPQTRYSRIIVSEDFRLFLPSFNNIEITMEPLVKSVFLLFLNHPEGILFKALPDYRCELKTIYNNVWRKQKSNIPISKEKMEKSIQEVTNPLSNSINEKCARIREAFLIHFDDYLAKEYYVTGYRGQPKFIKLPRHLVEWKS